MSRFTQKQDPTDECVAAWAKSTANMLKAPPRSALSNDGGKYNFLTYPHELFAGGVPVGPSRGVYQSVQKMMTLGDAQIERGYISSIWGTDTSFHQEHGRQRQVIEGGGGKTKAHPDLFIDSRESSKVHLYNHVYDANAPHGFRAEKDTLYNVAHIEFKRGEVHTEFNRPGVSAGKLSDILVQSEYATHFLKLAMKDLGGEGSPLKPVRVFNAVDAMNRKDEFMAKGEIPYMGEKLGREEGIGLSLSFVGHYIAASMPAKDLQNLPREFVGELIGAGICHKLRVARGEVATREGLKPVLAAAADAIEKKPHAAFDAMRTVGEAHHKFDQRMDKALENSPFRRSAFFAQLEAGVTTVSPSLANPKMDIERSKQSVSQQLAHTAEEVAPGTGVSA